VATQYEEPLVLQDKMDDGLEERLMLTCLGKVLKGHYSLAIQREQADSSLLDKKSLRVSSSTFL